MFLEEVFCFKVTHLLLHPAFCLTILNSIHHTLLWSMHISPCCSCVSSLFAPCIVWFQRKGILLTIWTMRGLFALAQFPWAVILYLVSRLGLQMKGLWFSQPFPELGEGEHRWSVTIWAQQGFVLTHSTQAAALRGFPLLPLQLPSDSTSQGKIKWIKMCFSRSVQKHSCLFEKIDHPHFHGLWWIIKELYEK